MGNAAPSVQLGCTVAIPVGRQHRSPVSRHIEDDESVIVQSLVILGAQERSPVRMGVFVVDWGAAVKARSGRSRAARMAAGAGEEGGLPWAIQEQRVADG
jgi:hypothetical protein